MTATHTPGPWVTTPAETVVVGFNDTDEVVGVVDANGRPVTNVGSVWDRPRTDANARLIAAAPDLLAAANVALAALDPENPGHVAAHEALTSAIAKATGASA